MTASPTPSDRPAAADGQTAEPFRLSEELRTRVEQAAAHAGLSVAEVCEQWVRQGLEEAEHQQSLAESAGRCSLRTGACSAGPVPLPVHQQLAVPG